MTKYSKPQLLKFRDDEIMDMIAAGASCPNCYQSDGGFTTNNCQGGNCSNCKQAYVWIPVLYEYRDPNPIFILEGGRTVGHDYIAGENARAFYRNY